MERMTRETVRLLLNAIKLRGDVYRGYAVMCLTWREWRIPAMTDKRFASREDARLWIDEYLAADSPTARCWDHYWQEYLAQSRQSDPIVEENVHHLLVDMPQKKLPEMAIEEEGVQQ